MSYVPYVGKGLNNLKTQLMLLYTLTKEDIG